jgi:hypothetical protein
MVRVAALAPGHGPILSLQTACRARSTTVVLALTFLSKPGQFKVVTPKQRKDVRTLTDVRSYLDSVTLETLLSQLKEKGITQKAFAEQIGMNTRHLAAIKSSKLRHHYFNELGATKLACLWVLEHLGTTKRR